MKIRGAGASFNLTLPLSDGSGNYSATYTKIAQVEEIGLPSSELGLAETSDLDSGFIERRPTMVDPGDIEIKLWFDPTDTTHQQLMTWLATPPQTAPSWQVQFPTTPPLKVTFSGFLTGFKLAGATVKDYVSGDVKISVTSLPVITTT